MCVCVCVCVCVCWGGGGLIEYKPGQQPQNDGYRNLGYNTCVYLDECISKR